ncbi:CD276 antigen-like [Emydura macquarii macquarii]|uniref:CD276 antigen-like n=1 Tax=Emydura macquarii macquarii TaxID=1129001 RepID=UPI00352A2BCA
MHAAPEMCLRSTVLALCCVAAAAWLQLSMGPTPVRVRPGQRVVLECLFGADYPPLDLEQLQVRWRHKGRTVLEFAGTARAARAGVSLAEDEVRNGNASLVLQGATASDSGEWTCYVLYPPDQAEGSLTLHVADPPAPPDACPLGGGAPQLRQLEEVIGDSLRSASELQQHLAQLAAEVNKCLRSQVAEERPAQAEAGGTNQTQA